MRPGRISDLVDRGFAVHALGCDLLDLPAAPADWLADITSDSDELIRYAEALRPGYDRLGRIIGQLAGLFILARLGSRFEADWPAVASVVEQGRHAEADLHAVQAPAVAARHHAYVLEALRKVMEVVHGFDTWLPARQPLRDRLDGWTRELQLAGTMLSGAAAESLGLMPVDFSQACCNCGVTHSRVALAHV